MPTCKNCEAQWTWKQTVTSFRLNCPYCGKKQYEAASSRWKNGILTLVLLILTFAANVFLDLTLGWSILIAIGLGLGVLAIQPFILELSSEQEPYV